jgi:hypothetical protein
MNDVNSIGKCTERNLHSGVSAMSDDTTGPGAWHGGRRFQPLYGVVIHHAQHCGDLEEMKALAELAEWYLAAEGDIAAELALLKAEIAKLESGSDG